MTTQREDGNLRRVYQRYLHRRFLDKFQIATLESKGIAIR